MKESTVSNSQALMSLAISQENKLKERERLQVEIVKLNTEKLVNDLALQLQSELSTMRLDMRSLKYENESLKIELEAEQSRLKKFKEQAIEAVNKDRDRLQSLESRSLWDQIKEIWR